MARNTADQPDRGGTPANARGFKGLLVYQKAFELAMDIFDVTKSFPKEETYSLTDQIRRSSRSVCTCIAEAYRKRLYSAHFVSKLADSDMENSETIVWLDFAQACSYVKPRGHSELVERAEEVGRLLHDAMKNPGKYR